MNDNKQGKRGIRVRSFLSWAFIISVGVHFALGGLIRFDPTYAAEPKEDPPLIVRVVVPSPKPTEPPTPPPKTTPPPVVAQHPPPQAFVVHPPPANSHIGDGPSQPRYSPGPGGPDGVVPQGTGDSTAPPILATAAPTPAPTPVVMPTRPSCAAPHVDAHTTLKAEADYPQLAQAQGAIGTASVRVALSETGAVTGADIYKSSGNAALDREAIKAARNSRYAPEIEDCQKVPGRYLFVVDFTSQ